MVTAGLMGTYTVLEVRWAKSQFEEDAKKANVSIVSLISPTLYSARVRTGEIFDAI
jgi:hypothetical protein